MEHEQLVEEIRIATREVFETMLSLPLAEGEPSIEPNGPAPCDGVVALIGMTGAWTGTGIISCPAVLACKFAGQFLMGAYDSVSDDVLDAVGELTNMIIGGIKTRMEEKLGPMALSVPTVIYGRNFTTRSLARHRWTVVRFDCEGNHLCVQLCVTQAAAGSSPRIPVGVALHESGR